MKFQDGENKFRILSSPIMGWEDWKDRKPIRFRMSQKPEKSVDPEKPVKHFWAFIVWNYVVNRIQILEIIQASIRKRLEALSKDAEWGSPFFYDIKVIRRGQKIEVEYEVNPISPKELDPKIKEEFAKTPIDLEELFTGGDPLVPRSAPTQGFWDKKTEPKITVISSEQVEKIESEVASWITPSDPKWRGNALAALKIESFAFLPRAFYDTVLSRIEARKQKVLEDEIPF
jgi:hypothetical protein